MKIVLFEKKIVDKERKMEYYYINLIRLGDERSLEKIFYEIGKDYF